MRRLTPAQEQRLEALRQAARLLDDAIVVPGTSYRIGLDPLIGLVPVLGDLLPALFSIAMLWQARDLGVPKVVQLRMVMNVAIDALLGIVPVAGDLFDAAWKANTKNLALLERHAREEHRPSAGDWAFVLVMAGLVVGIALTPVLLIYLLFQ